MRIFTPFIVLLFIAASSYSQDVFTGLKATSIAPGSELVRTSRYATIPDYIRFRSTNEIAPEQVISYLQQHFQLNSSMAFTLLNTMPDRLGFTHYRYQETFNNIPLEGTMYLVHVKDGMVTSMNGMIFPSIDGGTATLSESDALQDALQYVNAAKYAWEDQVTESMLKERMKNQDATWYPKAVMEYAPVQGKYAAGNYRLAFRFDVFALEPFSHQSIFVDAQSGQVIYTRTLVQDNNPTHATAVTAYSGNKTIVTDSEAVNRFYLRDTLRGGGVITLNMHQSTDYGNSNNFQDADNFWNNVNVNQDQYATDAHFGLEKTFDFYDSTYNRVSVDNNALQLVGYVHYDVNYFNAFWDDVGLTMNFGDGDPGSGVTPLTALDITGHECTHGVTQFTCNLNYFGESGGLNESFSDCAGEMVERMGKGTNDWLVGADIGFALRFFSDPTLDGVSAATYGDNNWNNFTDVHYWSGVQNHWFYILSVGDTGTNDLGTSYSVAGIGMDEAHAITYRNQSAYLVPSSVYADARFYAIQSAIDLYGGCSPQVISCTNAWHAVGVGPEFVAAVVSDFSASATSLCSLDNPVHFTNLSNNGQSYVWDFGDGTNSTDVNPDHQYTSEGTYTVTLHTDGGTCGSDSLQVIDYISIALPVPPLASDTSTCAGSPAVLTGSPSGTITWYVTSTTTAPVGTGSPFITPPLSATTTYYAENDISSGVQSAGPANNSFGTGSYFTLNNFHYLSFDAYDNFTLQSVTVYSNATGSRTIELRDNSGNLVNSSTQNIGNGTVSVTLNFPVTAGNGWTLGLADGSMSNLYRNQSGTTFPYTLSGVLSITGNDIPDQDHYYYFYNWQVQKAPCTSVRIPVKVTVFPAPNALFTFDFNTSTQVTFTNGSTGATTYTWNFGDGNTSTQSDPVHDYANPGVYSVQLIACNTDCCDTTTHSISVATGISEIAGIDALSVSPNPFNNYVQINYSGSNAAEMNIELTDVLGQILMTRTQHFSGGSQVLYLNTDELASGVYFVRVKENGSSQTYKVIKQE